MFKTVHVQFYKKREKWFDLMEKPHMVFWWVEPTAIYQLSTKPMRAFSTRSPWRLRHAFGWAEVMDAERIRALRCA